jgi:hypothetical protein
MSPYHLFGNDAAKWDSAAFERCVRGVSSVLLSLKKKPVIRYEQASPMAKQLANELQASHGEKGRGVYIANYLPPILSAY